MLRQATDDQIRQMLLQATGFEPTARDRLASRLVRDDIGSLFNMLRDPDDGRFRSYYLTTALVAASDADWKWQLNSDEIAWQWAERVRPFVSQPGTSPLRSSSSRRRFKSMTGCASSGFRCRICDAAQRRVARQPRASSAGRGRIRSMCSICTRLSRGPRGTYLNLDGHWSDAGVELAATVLARHIVAAGAAPGGATHERP